ncbi:MAG: eukaryotic-like serine/threonine-protein kinase, partial [Baekduia sp.]|nr:eukaryotic-like serine/threonine-protein kinase [Baekduia sp.]
QARGTDVDQRSDLYSLGIVLYELLTGSLPFNGDTPVEIAMKHISETPSPPSVLRPVVPHDLDLVVTRALAKDPDDRFPSAGDLGRAALAAVGDGPAPPPERLVARGAAAPGGALDDETQVPASVTPTEVAPSRSRLPAWTRRAVAPVASLLAGAAVVLIVVLALGNGKDKSPATGGQTTTSPSAIAAGQARATKTYSVDQRPNAITYARGRVWVTSVRTGTLVGLPAGRTGKRRTIKLPWSNGTTSVAAGFGSLWVTNGPQARLVRIDPVSGRLQGDRLLGSGEAVVVATGEGAVWVGRRAVKSTDPPSSIVKVLPSGGQTRIIPFGQEGVGDIAVGGGYVWVPNRRRNRVSRIDPATGERKSATIGNGRHRVAFGDGQVWVTNYNDGTVSQNNRSLTNLANDLTGVSGPLGIAVSGTTVWVASSLDDTVIRMSTKTGKPVGDPIPVGRNPFAVAAHGSTAWVTNVAAASVTRIDAK